MIRLAFRDLTGCIVNQNDVDYFRNLLNQRIAELRQEAGKTVENMDEDENFPDPTDRASMESNRNSILRIRDRERKLIFKIQEALRRLDDGEYGICEQCGEEIAIERLKARPVTTLCIGCKSSQELAERKAKKFI
ncbi:MAG TPA: RNA polymerase-binding protein DksA [Candidatus Binatia bacterium]|jgi:DnaK suppressor protein